MEDATLTLLNSLYHHFDNTMSNARVLFIDFSSAFNTIQPHLLAEKLLFESKLDFNIIGWILDFMTFRSQCVRVNAEKLYSSTGSSQGFMLSPVLYILYTNSCRSQFHNRQIIMFANDSVIISLLKGGELDHSPVVNDFVTKSEDMVIDLIIDHC